MAATTESPAFVLRSDDVTPVMARLVVVEFVALKFTAVKLLEKEFVVVAFVVVLFETVRPVMFATVELKLSTSPVEACKMFAKKVVDVALCIVVVPVIKRSARVVVPVT